MSTGSAPLWLTTNSCPKLLGDGFHSRDGIDGEKVLIGEKFEDQHLGLLHTFLERGSS